ncbi:MAG: lasso peptide biosynthesis B2 protein [Bacteroidales bacterium]
MMYYIKRILQIPAIERKLIVKGYLLCFAVWPVVYFLPLKKYMGLLKSAPKQPLPKDKATYIRLVRKTMRRIERFSPVRFSCLVKSVAFKLLLNGFGIESSIALGVNNSQPRLLKAHAWVKVEDEVVYLKRRRFWEVGKADNI